MPPMVINIGAAPRFSINTVSNMEYFYFSLQYIWIKINANELNISLITICRNNWNKIIYVNRQISPLSKMEYYV